MPTLFQICVEGNAGSIGRIAEGIGIEAINNGWTSYIAYSRFRRPSKSNIIHIGTKLDIIYHGIITRLFDKQGYGSVRATKKLIKRIKGIKPEVIQLHHLHGYFINIELLFNYLSQANIPVVWTFHDCWSLTGHCAHFDFIRCEKWKTQCYNCPQKKEYPRSVLIDRSRKNYLMKKTLFNSVGNITIVNVSAWLNSVVESSFMSLIDRTVIFNGIDFNKFSPQSSTDSIRSKYFLEGKFIILGVAGVWTERKGFRDFIELSNILHEEDSMVLVGLTQRQIRSLPRNIIGVRKTENYQDLAEWYSAANVYLNLSFEETFGLTTAEALSCGTPAVVYNSTACPEIVDKETGFVVNQSDFEGIISAIETVKNNGKQYYSTACRARAIKYFNKEDSLKEYVNLYQKLTHGLI